MSEEKSNSKKMGVIELTIITTVNMLGSGIVMLPSKMAQVGSMSIFSWIVTLGGSLCLAWGFSRAAMFSKRSAGMGGYAEYAYGTNGSFMTNYTYALSLVISNVAIAVSAVSYFSVFFNATLSPLAAAIWAIVVIIITTVANFWGAKITGRIGSVTVWGVIIPVVLLGTIGWFWFHGHIYAASWNPHHYGFFSGLGASIPITLWAFLGLESASVNMDAVSNPQKSVPIACLSGTILAGIIYIASTNVMMGVVHNHALMNSNAPFGLTFALMWGHWAGKLCELLMAIACVGSLLGWQFTIAQVFKSSADAHYFPKVFSKVSKNDAPVVGMIILLICQILLAFMTISPNMNKQFNVLVNLAVVTDLVPYVLSMGAVPIIQLAGGVESHDNKYRWTWVIIIIASLYSLYAMYECGSLSMVLGSLVTFFGWTLFAFIAKRFNLENDIKFNKGIK